MDNYPPGPMTGRGGPFDDGCPCTGCPALTFGTCYCELEEVDDEGLGGLPDLLCNLCGCCREHCQCYEDEAALEVEQGDLLDALDPDRESGLEWDAGADLTPTRQPPVHRAGQNEWVTRDLAHPWPGEEGLYFEEQRWADQTPPMTCPHGHVADFKELARECLSPVNGIGIRAPHRLAGRARAYTFSQTLFRFRARHKEESYEVAIW